MLDYFWKGMQMVWESTDMLRYTFYFLLIYLTFTVWRRWNIVRQSGGDFFAPYHIAHGNFYIHRACFPKKRIIPLNEIEQITTGYVRGIGGARHTLCIERKSGEESTLLFGRNKKNDRLVENLSEEVSKYKIKVRQARDWESKTRQSHLY